MTGKSRNFLLNGATGRVAVKSIRPVKLWKRIQINEWTCSSFLFAISLAIVLGKLCVNYGGILHQQSNTKYARMSVALASNASETVETFKFPYYARCTEFPVTNGIDLIVEYGDIVGSSVISSAKAYGWLMRAALCGLMMMGFTWFIIYKDSSIPGVNPPFPFSPSKYRLPDTPKIQINYLVGILNGILIFFYMCL